MKAKWFLVILCASAFKKSYPMMDGKATIF